MFETSTADDNSSDNEVDSLHASLLITTTTSTTTTTNFSGKYGRLWRRTGYVGILISTPKRSSHHHGVPQSSPSYVDVPQSPSDDKFSRISSRTRCDVRINIPPDGEKEEGESTASSSKYRRLWRRTGCVGILISTPKKSSHHHGVSLSPSDEQSEVRINTSTDCERVEDEEELLRNRIVEIVEERDLGSLQRFGGVERVASILISQLQSRIDNGVEPRGWDTTTNRISPAKVFFRFVFEACNSYTVFLLLILAGLSFVINIIEEGPNYGWPEGTAILFTVFLLVIFSSTANFRAKQEEEEKELVKKNKRVNVERGGMPQEVNISGIKMGDILFLNEGDRIPADGLLVRGDGLVVDEAMDSNIDRDQNPFLYYGSKIIRGHGGMLVISVGTGTKLGKLLGFGRSDDPKEKTVLEAKIEKPISYMDGAALFMSVLISLVLLLHLLRRKAGGDNGLPELKGEIPLGKLMKIFERILLRPRGIVTLTSSLTAMMIALQHGMALVITTSLSYWNETFSNLVDLRNLFACGNMGLVDVICVDMCTQMVEIGSFWIGEKDVKDDEDFTTYRSVLETLSHGISVSVPVPEISVSPIDDLLISWAKSRRGMNMESLDQMFDVLHYRKLCSNRRGVGVLMRKNGDDENTLHLHWKGVASTVLGMCSHYYECGGETCVMGSQKSKFEQVIKDMEDGGLKPIAYAYQQTEIQELREDGLILLAIAGFKYPTLDALTDSGVCIKLVSSDKLSVVKAIACELGLFTPGSAELKLIEGEDFRNFSDIEKVEKVDEIIVMGSSLPKDKLLFVKCLKQKGHIVAFCGVPTTSDVPVLKEADVGVTEKIRSTEMAREISDFVILDDGFSSLSPILKDARCLYGRIQKFVQLQLTSFISGFLVSFITTICVGDSPITALQLIWVNLIMCLLGGPMLVMKSLSQELMTSQPAKRSESLITKIMWKGIITQALYQAVVLLSFQFKGTAIHGMNEKAVKGLIFNSFTLCQVFNLFNVMDLMKKEVFEVVHRSYCFLMAVGAIMIAQFLVVEFAGSLANCARLNGVEWALCFIVAALSWGLNRAVKFTSNFHTEWLFRSVRPRFGFSSRNGIASPRAFLLVFPFSMFLLFSVILFQPIN